jgi:hypothetical protein
VIEVSSKNPVIPSAELSWQKEVLKISKCRATYKSIDDKSSS